MKCEMCKTAEGSHYGKDRLFCLHGEHDRHCYVCLTCFRLIILAGLTHRVFDETCQEIKAQLFPMQALGEKNKR